MAFTVMYFVALLAGGALAQQDGTCLLQSGVSSHGEETLHTFTDSYTDSYTEEMMAASASLEGGFGLLLEDAPEFCKNETQLTWKQRKERMQQHATLEWAKDMMKRLMSFNETVPEWMNKMVSDDRERGRTKWAVVESKRLQDAGKEVPEWMADLVAEDTKWANRWAACKAAQLKVQNMEVPAWMAENGRKGVMEAAAEKETLLQEELNELEEQREEESAVVNAQGDVKLANRIMLARKQEYKTRSLDQQYRALEEALKQFELAEREMLEEPGSKAGIRKAKQALRKARRESELLQRILEGKSQALLAQLDTSLQ